MTGFEPQTSGVGSNHSTNLATTTAQKFMLITTRPEHCFSSRASSDIFYFDLLNLLFTLFSLSLLCSICRKWCPFIPVLSHLLALFSISICQSRGNFSSQTISVTRLGEFSPLWRKFKSIWHIFEGLFLIWQMCCIIGLIFIALGKWSNIEKLSNHLVTLQTISLSLPLCPILSYLSPLCHFMLAYLLLPSAFAPHLHLHLCQFSPSTLFKILTWSSKVREVRPRLDSPNGQLKRWLKAPAG